MNSNAQKTSFASDEKCVPRLGLVQMPCGESQKANLAAALERISAAAERGCNIICTQELFTAHYPCQDEDHRRFVAAEPVPGPTTDALGHAARQHGVVIIGSVFERRAPGLYHNTAVVIDADGSLAGTYRKMHIPDDPLYYEKFYFTPGDADGGDGNGFRAFETRYGKVGVCVCWDQWFPEAARLTALAGAEIIFYPTAIGWLPDEKERYGASQHSAWETMMRSHAIANGVYVAAVNRVGFEGSLEFWGSSFVADPNGNVIAKAGHQGEELVTADCDLRTIDVIRTHWPFLRDRRVDAYQGLSRRWIGGG